MLHRPAGWGGVKGGYAYGKSDAHARFSLENLVKPEDVAATLYYLLGIDPLTEIYDLDHRPLMIGGNVVKDVIA
ncbi:MAG: DUF1501 domain-containing protein [Rubripirellula sp.]|nr:DUF1501 domain-containing protein [Rubripirellula sp.]